MKNKILITLALMLTAIISIKADETNCFPPCADVVTTHEQYSSEACPGCYMEIYYDQAIANNCNPPTSYISIKEVKIPPNCIGVGKCFETYMDAFFAAADELFENVIRWLPNDVIKIEFKPCWQFTTNTTGTFHRITPCDGIEGCCVYTFNKITQTIEILPYSIICEGDCVLGCGWSPVLTYNSLEKRVLNEQIKSNITISPNPASNEITITNDNLDIVVSKIEISDLSGKIIINKTDEINKNLIVLNTKQLNNGTYFVNIYDGEKLIYSNKIMIQK